MIELYIQQEYQLPLARRQALELASELGFSKLQAYSLATAVSELASNLVFHTERGGQLSLRRLQSEERWGIEVLAEDQGPGIADLELALRDGYSTRGSLGCGLPGARRLMDGFEIHSEPGTGTRIRTWKWQK